MAGTSVGSVYISAGLDLSELESGFLRIEHGMDNLSILADNLGLDFRRIFQTEIPAAIDAMAARLNTLAPIIPGLGQTPITDNSIWRGGGGFEMPPIEIPAPPPRPAPTPETNTAWMGDLANAIGQAVGAAIAINHPTTTTPSQSQINLHIDGTKFAEAIMDDLVGAFSRKDIRLN
ncbi:MAG: hypothetical protein FWB71_01375 [Defluviitaleaceae bacterium]|nr:hypothetical protein [Defluviitaleaceae bacterium]